MHEYIITTKGDGAYLSPTNGGSVSVGRSFRPEYGFSFDVTRASNSFIVASFQFLEEAIEITKFLDQGDSPTSTVGQASFEKFQVEMRRRGARYNYEIERFKMLIQLTDL